MHILFLVWVLEKTEELSLSLVGTHSLLLKLINSRIGTTKDSDTSGSAFSPKGCLTVTDCAWFTSYLTLRRRTFWADPFQTPYLGIESIKKYIYLSTYLLSHIHDAAICTYSLIEQVFISGTTSGSSGMKAWMPAFSWLCVLSKAIGGILRNRAVVLADADAWHLEALHVWKSQGNPLTNKKKFSFQDFVFSIGMKPIFHLFHLLILGEEVA